MYTMLHGDFVSSIVGTLNFKMPHWIHKIQGNGFLNQIVSLFRRLEKPIQIMGTRTNLPGS